MSNIFGNRLREAREERGYNQTIIAELFHTTKATVSRWENGQFEPNLDEIIMLAKFLDVSVDYLVGLENYDGTRFIGSIPSAKPKYQEFEKLLDQMTPQNKKRLLTIAKTFTEDDGDAGNIPLRPIRYKK